MSYKYLIFLVTCATVINADDAVQPCKSNDLACIGKYLAQGAKCDPKNLAKITIDPYEIKHIHLETPGFNCSEDRYDTIYTGLNTGVVDNFIVDEKTDKAVLTLRFPSLMHNSTTQVNFYQPGQEPFSIITKGKYAGFKDIIFTVMFKSAKNFELKTAKIYTYLSEPPSWNLGDGALQEAAKTNKQIADTIALWSSATTIGSLEPWNYRAPKVVTLFVNKNICRYTYPAQIPGVNS